MVCMAPVGLILLPSVQARLGMKEPAFEVRAIGVVQRVQYLPGIRMFTQLDVGSSLDTTKTTPFLVRGQAALPIGTAMDLRSRGDEAQICVRGSDQCWIVRPSH